MLPFTIVTPRTPIEDFNIDLFSRLLAKFTHAHDAFYLRASHDFASMLKRIEDSFTGNRSIVLFIKDNLEMTGHGYWMDRQPQKGSLLIKDLVDRYPDRDFLLLSTLENLDAEISAPNLEIVNMCGEGLDQRRLYRTLVPCREKNMDSQFSFISLNRHNRLHRVTILSYLFGHGIDRYGLISCICQGPKEDFYRPMMDADISDQSKQVLSLGIDRLWSSEFDRTYNIYEIYNNNHFYNFDHKLRPRYREVFVDLVSETMFSSPAYLVTEKTFHAMHGYCFPIIFNSAGAVQHLREMGCDMFDDVIDHSYDDILHAVPRLIAAIDRNQRLLTDVEHAKRHWQANYHRFEHNAEIARNGCEQFYVQRAQNRIDRYLERFQNR